MLAAIVRAGRQPKGRFTSTSPSDAARVFVSLVLGANEEAGDLFVARQAGDVTFEEVDGGIRRLSAKPSNGSSALPAGIASRWPTDRPSTQWFD